MFSASLASLALLFILQVADFIERVEETPLVSDSGVLSRIQYERATVLRLDGMKLSQREWGQVGSLASLRAISLRDSNFADADICYLLRLKQLRYVDLSSTTVTDESVNELIDLPKLRAVCLADVAVTPTAVQWLKDHFKKKQSRELLVGHSPRGTKHARDSETGMLCCQSSEVQLEVTDAIAPTEQQMKPYDELIEHTDVKIRMLPILGGSFLMGSPESEPHRKADEGPQRKVTLAPFWMAESETTWDAFLVWEEDLDIPRRKELGLIETERDRKADKFQLGQPEMAYYKTDMGMGYEGRPAIRMTQLSARTFCKWLSAKTGRYYRLPTEAEWEYACRAGTTTAYSWGDDPKAIDDYACYYNDTDINSGDSTAKVRQKKPNRWGLYDMHGNVAEWVLDQFEPHYYARDRVKVNPLNVPQTLYPRVVRGGSYNDDPDGLRSAARAKSSIEWMDEEPRIPQGIWWHRGSDYWFGFRIVRPLEEPSDEEKVRKWDAQQPAGQREKWAKTRR